MASNGKGESESKADRAADKKAGIKENSLARRAQGLKEAVIHSSSQVMPAMARHTKGNAIRHIVSQIGCLRPMLDMMCVENLPFGPAAILTDEVVSCEDGGAPRPILCRPMSLANAAFPERRLGSLERLSLGAAGQRTVMERVRGHLVGRPSKLPPALRARQGDRSHARFGEAPHRAEAIAALLDSIETAKKGSATMFAGSGDGAPASVPAISGRIKRHIEAPIRCATPPAVEAARGLNDVVIIAKGVTHCLT